MPGIQPLPGARNPWVDSLPRFIQNLALQKVAQNFRAKELEMQREFDEAQDKKRAEARAEQGEKNREAKATEAKLKRETPKPMNKLVKGPEKYWQHKGGVSTKTDIPVPPQRTGTSLEDKRNLAQFRHDLRKKLVGYKNTYGSKKPGTMSPNQERLLEKDVASMAMTIEGAKDDPAVKQATVFFNKFNKGNTVYLWTRGKDKWYGGAGSEEAVRVDLPVINGKQVTAADIRETRKQNPDKSLEDILKQIGAYK
jgi:hypothetical protein